MKDKPGRRISLLVEVDHGRALVNISRRLADTRGFLVDVGAVGTMPLDEWREFLAKQTVAAASAPTLMQSFCLMGEGENQTKHRTEATDGT